MRGTVLLDLHINLHTERKVSLRYLVKKPTDYLSPTMADKTIGRVRPDTLSGCLFAGITTESRTYIG